MASTASTTISSASSLVTHPDSKLIFGGLVTRKSCNQGGPFPLTTAHIVSANREPIDTPSPYALSGVGSNRPQSRYRTVLPLTVRHTVASAEPRDNLETYRILNPSSQRTISTNSPAELRELWYNSFLNGCWSNTLSDLHTAGVVSYGSWTDKSTPNLLAKMFMAQYSRAFTNPWVFNTGTLRVIKFLEAVGRQLKKERGVLSFLEFRASVRKSAVDAFHLSIDLTAPNILNRACYLGAIFHHGLVCGADVFYALARIARLAKRLEHFQAFYYLLVEAGAELYSQPCAIREIRQHAWVLRDALTDSDEPVSNLRWHILIDELIETYESRSHPYNDPATGEMSWFR